MKKIFYIIGVSVICLLVGGVYGISMGRELSGGLVRLHVLANSNSGYDQQVKLAVRDAVLESVEGTIKTGADRKTVLESTDMLQKAAEKKLKELGIEYSARICVETTQFPRKNYAGITLPAGKYESIRVVLGEGKGENWWCVAYPPLCFTEGAVGDLSPEGETLLEKQLSPQSYNLIQNSRTPQIQYRLKLVEWANAIGEKLNGKGQDS